MKRNWLEGRRARDLSRDLCEEMQFHLEMRAAEHEQEGATSQDALAAAHKQFGSTAIAYEEARREHLGRLRFPLETAGREFRFAARSLRRAPSFTAAAVLALALGIGAASAVFSIADRVLFRGLPYAGGDRLVSLGVRAPIAKSAFLLGGDYSEWKEEHSAFEAFTSTRGAADCDITETNPVRVGCAQVEWNFLPAFGLRLAAGRNFTREEDQPKAAMAALISYPLWKERYGGDPRIEGRRTSLDGHPATIVGVLPPSFEFPTLAPVDVLFPQQLDEPVERERKAVTMVTAFGRLKPGVSISQAKTALGPYFDRFLTTISPAFRKEVGVEVVSLNELLRARSRTAAWVLLAAVLSVLFIAWTNVANLWLARAASREHEARIREALGASRARLAMHHAAEFALLATAGWAGGLAVAGGLLAVFRKTGPEGIIGLRFASLDGRILIFSAAVLAVWVFALSVLPLGGGARSMQGSRVAGARNMRLRSGLVTAQLAASVALAASAGLLIHSLREMDKIEIGAQTEGAVTASVVLGQQHFRNGADRYAFVARLEGDLRRLPGVSAAAVADELPPLVAGIPFMFSSIAVDGRPPLPAKEPGGMVSERHITADYFRALGIRMLAGRPFSTADMNNADGVAIVSDRLARRLFPNRDATGHTLRPTGWPKTYAIVGVAANVKNAGLTSEDALEMYLPYDAAQGNARFVSAVVRGSAKPSLMASLMSAEIRSLDATLPAKIETYEDRIAELNQRPRFNTALLALFAAIGVLLAALGVYGVLAFLVSQRIREIGVRMALGATRGSIVRWILSYAMRWAAIGLALGSAGAFAAARQIRSMLYGVTPADPWTISAMVVLLAAVAAIAAWFPARRAATLDPAVTLREQ